jgi:astacin
MKANFFSAAVPAGAMMLALLTGSGTALATPPPCCAPEITPAEAVPPGYELIEGDILVRLPAPGEFAPASTFKTTQFWPSGIVYYEFDANVSAANRTIAISAMSEWEAVANVDFRPRNSEANYIHIQDSTANNSEVGMVGEEQIINIVSWGTKFRIVHELGHSLGFYHEQSRSDRDSYVTINWANITSGKEGNFEIRDDSSHYGPYDFDSVMHYAECDFSICENCSAACRTIVVKAPYAAEWQDNIGQRNHLSQMDAMTMSFLYPESNWRFLDRNYGGIIEVGTFLFPAKTFPNGVAFTPSGGTLWIQPGNYAAVGTHSKAMTLRAPLGGVLLRN